MPKNKPPHKQYPRHSDALAEHRGWLARAEKVALLPFNQGGSTHPTVKVGAVLVDKDGHEIAAAANRFAHGLDRRRPERYKNGSKSLWVNCAEQMAVARAARLGVPLNEARLYVTLEPCAVCAGLLAELHIKQVFVPVGAMRRYAKLKSKWKQSIEVGLIKLAEAGITLTSIDTNTVPSGRRTKR